MTSRTKWWVEKIAPIVKTKLTSADTLNDKPTELDDNIDLDINDICYFRLLKHCIPISRMKSSVVLNLMS